jgi:hypothetical protein
MASVPFDAHIIAERFYVDLVPDPEAAQAAPSDIVA